MPFTEQRTCVVCNEEFTAHSHNAQACPPPKRCRGSHLNATRRNEQIPNRDCANCGQSFQPKKPEHVYHNWDCSQDALTDKRKRPPDGQMQKLFRYYRERASYKVTDRPDGTKLVSLSDLQFPFVDLPLLDAVYRFIDDWEPDDVILNGDIVDCYAISTFSQQPGRLFDIDDELEMASDLLTGIRRRSPKANLHWIDGNHEERMLRVIAEQAQGFESLVKDIPERLHLDDYCESFVPYGKHVDFLGMVFTHGEIVRQHSAYAARANMERYRSSGVSGHTHRAGSHSSTDMHGRSHTWIEQGCLCRKDLEYIKSVANWQHAFVIGTVWNNALHPQLIRVIETSKGRGFTVDGNYYGIV